jgi:hypothetical protein
VSINVGTKEILFLVVGLLILASLVPVHSLMVEF